MKRLLDLCFATYLLMLLLPGILIIGILVRSNLGSPIIFKQERPGQNGKPFYLYKFRSMTDQRDSNGNLFSDHIRLTSFGKFLRKYSIDEWPQLINVLKGDLSLVGPRPLLMEYLPLYNEEQAKRHIVKPGITGWAQINGRNTLTWEEKFKLDSWYVENRSFLLDIKIILLTIVKVIKKEGIEHSNHVTMPLFKGSYNEYEKM